MKKILSFTKSYHLSSSSFFEDFFRQLSRRDVIAQKRQFQQVIPFSGTEASFSDVNRFDTFRMDNILVSDLIKQDSKPSLNGEVAIQDVLRKHNPQDSIVRVIDSNGYCGSGMKISDSLIMLPLHVINQKPFDQLQFSFPSGEFSMQGIVEYDASLDYVIIKLNDSEDAKLASIPNIKLKDSVSSVTVLLHHPAGKELTCSIHENEQTDFFQYWRESYHPSENGSSGGVYLEADGACSSMHIGLLNQDGYLKRVSLPIQYISASKPDGIAACLIRKESVDDIDLLKFSDNCLEASTLDFDLEYNYRLLNLVDLDAIEAEILKGLGIKASRPDIPIVSYPKSLSELENLQPRIHPAILDKIKIKSPEDDYLPWKPLGNFNFDLFRIKDYLTKDQLMAYAGHIIFDLFQQSHRFSLDRVSAMFATDVVTYSKDGNSIQYVVDAKQDLPVHSSKKHFYLKGFEVNCDQPIINQTYNLHNLGAKDKGPKNSHVGFYFKGINSGKSFSITGHVLTPVDSSRFRINQGDTLSITTPKFVQAGTVTKEV